jgi:predicted RNA-binding Zn ribbon-like protein
MSSISITEHRPSGDHHHEMSLDDTFDFLNTIELESGSLVDRFETFDDVAGWLAGRGICHFDDYAATPIAGFSDEAALARVRAVRAALREVAHSVADARPADPAAVAEVNRAIRERERIELVPEPDGISIGHSHVGDPLDDALAQLADPLVDEIRSGRADRVRICASDTCRWVFHDESRAGRRRWCDMATCGNRAKAARHRARQKAADTAAGAGAGDTMAASPN